MKGYNSGHRSRMRQRYLEEGIKSFQPHEVMEMLLYMCLPQKDTNKIAHQLIDTFGSYSAVMDAPVEELAKIHGISTTTATNIKLIRDSYHAYDCCKALSSVSESSHKDMIQQCIDSIHNSNIERLLAIYVDGNSCYKGKKMFENNSVGSVYVNNKDIVTGAMSYNARGVLLFHNHVQGKCRPSKADIKYTEGLYATLKGLDIVLLDHFIVTADKNSYSMRGNGIMTIIQDKYNK